VLHFCHIDDAAAKAMILTKESNDESDEIWKRRGCGEKEKGPIRIGPNSGHHDGWMMNDGGFQVGDLAIF
jgi:hypothetical protein